MPGDDPSGKGKAEIGGGSPMGPGLGCALISSSKKRDTFFPDPLKRNPSALASQTKFSFGSNICRRRMLAGRNRAGYDDRARFPGPTYDKSHNLERVCSDSS